MTFYNTYLTLIWQELQDIIYVRTIKGTNLEWPAMKTQFVTDHYWQQNISFSHWTAVSKQAQTRPRLLVVTTNSYFKNKILTMMPLLIYLEAKLTIPDMDKTGSYWLFHAKTSDFACGWAMKNYVLSKRNNKTAKTTKWPKDQIKT